MKRTPKSHLFRAQLRDAWVLIRESRSSILWFFGVVLIGGMIFAFYYHDPVTGQPIGFLHGVYGAFTLIFFETSLDFPDTWYLQILFFLIPILGLAAVADGVIRFGTALVNKQNRGQKWIYAMASTYKNHVIVCGIGKLGFRVIEELLKLDRDVIGIEINPDGRFVEKANDLGVPILIADARRSETLQKANVKQADVIIPCTEDELANLDIALDARESNSGIKVVMRMFDPELAARVEKGFGIHTVFSTSALSAPIFAAAAMRLNVKSSFYVGETLLNLIEMVVEPCAEFNGWTIEALQKQVDISILYFQDDHTTDLHPNGSLVLHAGAKILVLATLENLYQLNEMNCGRHHWK